jgi:hypothetical protein
VTPPVMILALPRSFTSVTSAMLGEHPELLGVPELNLFTAERMEDWWMVHSRGRGVHANGLVRAVAHLYFGEQTEETAALARRWLRMRLHRTTTSVYHELVARAHPLAVVDKSPLNIRAAALRRLRLAFPDARYVRLRRDPHERARSVERTLEQLGVAAPLLDPMAQSRAAEMRLSRFLAQIPSERVCELGGEDLLSDPDRHLRDLADWLGVGTDAAAIAAMKRPERSPFACFGPSSAPLGHDIEFLRRPALRPERSRDMVNASHQEGRQ